MPCYLIPYRDRFGAHDAFKWGETPAAALASLRKSHTAPGRGAAEYDAPQLVNPQPFDTRAKPTSPTTSAS